jgi:hypothetical protein
VPPLPSKRNAPGRTLSVCELSLNLVAYAGEIVSVRGVYDRGLRQTCPQQCPNGEPWPSVLDPDARTDCTDQASWDAVGPCDLVANGIPPGLAARDWHGGYLIVERMTDLEMLGR